MPSKRARTAGEAHSQATAGVVELHRSRFVEWQPAAVVALAASGDGSRRGVFYPASAAFFVFFHWAKDSKRGVSARSFCRCCRLVGIFFFLNEVAALPAAAAAAAASERMLRMRPRLLLLLL